MIKRILCLVVLLGFGVQAHATVISFDPSSTNVGLGNTVSIDLVISDLGDEILTGFDLDILYDDTLLGFEGFTFGTGLDTFGFGTLNEVVDWGFGVVEVFELSFDFDVDLFDFQPDEFVLGTITFTGLEYGISALDIFIWSLAGEYVFDEVLGFEIASELDATVEGGQIEVPEPGTWLLLMSGLLFLQFRRRSDPVRA